MRTSIPEYARVVAPLHELMELAYGMKGNRTKRKLNKYNLERLGWNSIHEDIFSALKLQLCEKVKLWYPRETSVLCLFPDASQFAWGSIITSVLSYNDLIPIEEQDHVPIAFHSGTFTKSQLNWHIQDKEAFSIIETVRKNRYLFASYSFHLFCDNKNLTYIYRPEAVVTDDTITTATKSRLTRWGEELSTFSYDICHIPGEINVWADMLSRWSNPGYRAVIRDLIASKDSIMTTKLITLELAKITPMEEPDVQAYIVEALRTPRVAMANHPDSDSLEEFWNFGYSPIAIDFNFPTADRIRSVQEEHRIPSDELHEGNHGMLYTVQNKIWIPDSANELQLSLIIMAHCGRAGHRSLTTTKSNLTDYWWDQKIPQLEQFCRSCLQCQCSKGGHTTPRPWGVQLQSTGRNDCIAFDYCYIDKPSEGALHNYKYVLVIKCTFSQFVVLTPAVSTTSHECAQALALWFAYFGEANKWISDQGTHFKNTLMQNLAQQLGTLHHFTSAYSHWANGSVERVNRVLLEVLRSIIAETGLDWSDWPYLLPVIMEIINSTSSDSLGNYCPREVFLNLPPTNPVKIYIPRGSPTSDLLVQPPDILFSTLMTELAEATRKMHTVVVKHKEIRRRRNEKNRVHQSSLINFGLGDYVLWAQRHLNAPRKWMVSWMGPYKISRVVHDYVYEIEHLLTHETKEVHATRLRFYSDSALNITQILKDNLEIQNKYNFVIQGIRDSRMNVDPWQFCVCWKGFDESENDWLPFHEVATAAPALLAAYGQEHLSSENWALLQDALRVSLNSS